MILESASAAAEYDDDVIRLSHFSSCMMGIYFRKDSRSSFNDIKESIIKMKKKIMNAVYSELSNRHSNFPALEKNISSLARFITKAFEDNP